VLVNRQCACGCGTFLTGRSDKKYATGACSKRARRQSAAEAPASSLPPATDIADALRSELIDLGLVRTPEAMIALGLAAQLDGGRVIGSQFVSLSRELDRRVDALRLRGERPDDPAVLIQRRLEAKQLRLLQEGS
jgi:hypothetical protein